MMERTVSEQAFWGFMAIAQRNWPLYAGPAQRTDMARNAAARACLAGDYTHLCMLDIDHVHPADVVERLARWVVKNPEIQVVGGLNFKRAAPFEPCLFFDDERGQRYQALDWAEGLLECAVVGTGCILIARQVFEVIKPPWFEYVYESSGFSPSEDVVFCQKCRAAGIKIWCDTTTTSPHIAQITIDKRHYQKFMETHPERIEEIGG